MTNLRVVQSDRRSESNSLNAVLDAARLEFVAQSRAVASLADRVDDDFCSAIQLIIQRKGRLIICGIGKSGHIGKKLAATFSCSGTPSFFLHAGEAAHGDLGMVGCADVVMLISNSGETDELVCLIPFLKEINVSIVALVGNLKSSVARVSDCVLDISVEREACPHDLVPTTSSLAALAMGDALAMAVMRTRQFSKGDFGRFHPGGSLGRQLNGQVHDVMQRQPLPTCSPQCSIGEMLNRMSNGHCGLVIVIDEANTPIGLVTDGDLRRALQLHANLTEQKARDVMTMNPVTIQETSSTREARARMHRLRLKALLVVNLDGKLTGIIEIFGDHSID